MTDLTPEEIDARVAAHLDEVRAQRAERVKVRQEADRKRSASKRRRSERRPSPSAITRARIADKLRIYNAKQDAPASEVRDARIAKGWTQAETARVAGIPITSYRDVEKGHSKDLVNIGRTRHVLGLPL